MRPSTMTIFYEFPSEEGDISPFVLNDFLWLKYKLCLLKSCFSAICFDVGMVYLIDMFLILHVFDWFI